MITVDKLMDNIRAYAILQIEQLSKNTPIVAFTKPLLLRALESNISKLPNILQFITDKNGNIDIENILSEMTQSIINTQKFSIPTKFIGDIHIGEGQIVFDIPFIGKQIVLNSNDFEQFKEMIINK